MWVVVFGGETCQSICFNVDEIASKDADTYTYNSQRTPWTPNSELRNFEYDSNGNIVSKTDQTGRITYTYDVDNCHAQLVTYYYDHFGKRLLKDVSGVQTYFFHSDEDRIGKYNGSGNEIKSYGYAPNSTWTTNPLFMKQGDNEYFYHNDHLMITSAPHRE